MQTTKDFFVPDTFMDTLMKESLFSGGFNIVIQPRRFLPYLPIENISYRISATNYSKNGKRMTRFSPHSISIKYSLLPRFDLSSNFRLRGDGRFYLNLSGSLKVNSNNRLYLRVNSVSNRGHLRDDDLTISYWRRF